MKRLLLIPALCGFFIAQVQAAATDIGFSPWTKNVKWYRAAAQSDLSSLTPSADAGTIACAWAVSENTIHTYNGTSWTTGGPCSTGSGSSSTSPAYVTIVDSSGDSAVDAAANAIKEIGASKSGACSNADVDTIEELCSITVTGYDKCTVVFTVATAALSDFNVDLSNDATTFYTVATAAADYTNPAGHIYGASGDLTVAATSGTHWIEVDGLAGLDTLRLQAAGTSSAVTGTYRCTVGQ